MKTACFLTGIHSIVPLNSVTNGRNFHKIVCHTTRVMMLSAVPRSAHLTAILPM